MNAQNSKNEAQNVNLDWKIGVEKTIYQVDSTTIFKKDSIFMSTGVSSNYVIKVASLQDTIYEVLFKQVILDKNITVESELINTTPIQKMMQDLVKELQEKMSGLEYTFYVNKNTALAFEVKNQDQLIKFIEEMVVIVLNKYLDISKVEMDETKKSEVQLKVKKYMKEQMPAAMQTMLNSYNYIFQAYSFPFVIDETYTTDVEVYSVDQVQNGEKVNKAGLVVKSNIEDQKLKIDYIYEYDKQSAYNDYIVSQGKAEQIPFEQFDLSEQVISFFDTESTWLTNCSSFIMVKMGDVLVNKRTHIQVK
jgi:hypothetical protein